MTKRRINAVRRDIVRIIEGHMANQDVSYYEVDLFKMPRCPLINPLCPNDLCVLYAGHPGSDDGIHVLGTDPYDLAQRYESFTMAKIGTSDEELIRLGWLEQKRQGIG